MIALLKIVHVQDQVVDVVHIVHLSVMQEENIL